MCVVACGYSCVVCVFSVTPFVRLCSFVFVVLLLCCSPLNDFVRACSCIVVVWCMMGLLGVSLCLRVCVSLAFC